MNYNIIKASLITLEKSRKLLLTISDKELCNNTVSPYYSSIGSHIRHILDFYECILVKGNSIDLTKRKRNFDTENHCNCAIAYLDELVAKLNNEEYILERNVNVIDDLGTGKLEISYTFSSLLAQANSHTIHHYAIITYILDSLGIQIEDSSFGYNPTTPRKEESIIKS